MIMRRSLDPFPDSRWAKGLLNASEGDPCLGGKEATGLRARAIGLPQPRGLCTSLHECWSGPCKEAVRDKSEASLQDECAA